MRSEHFLRHSARAREAMSQPPLLWLKLVIAIALTRLASVHAINPCEAYTDDNDSVVIGSHYSRGSPQKQDRHGKLSMPCDIHLK